MAEENGGGATATTTGNNEVEDAGAGTIKIKVTYGSNNFDVFIPPQSTFADLKKVIAKATGLEPEVQNLLFRGKGKDDHESLHMAGVKDNAKVIVMENSPSKDEDLAKVEEVKENVEEISRGVDAVRIVREENDQFAEQVASLEAVVGSGTQVSDKDFLFLTEMLMRQLLKLDGIDAEGEGRIQRKSEVRRVQGLVEKLDNLKARNSNPSTDVPETASGEASMESSTKVTEKWEVFE
ncbi:BAG family molecular chaperone regulator 4-like isoform X1 [Cynara cardunculus var. scolymus]|uniref:BAG family molecular chaperone regulator 4-like isoform X1 n=1 Tax=Cynara cardunculus var. scolymus TaxID=59895 RepID=UPI000D62419B|nr:BAG family molecular chaperone regulator 4-like isoform X1 [Cynara cardunculus var. scolymus]